jgi:hypothetical protein
MTDDANRYGYDEYVGHETLGDLWRLTQGGKTLRCVLTTHPLGWELRQLRGDALTRSQVCKTSAVVVDVAEAWKADATEHGWRDD